MKLAIIFLALCCSTAFTLPLTEAEDLGARIVGGRSVDIGLHGHQVSLREKPIFYPEDPFYHVCGGSIYLENIIITAAHCVIATVASQWKVVAGTNFHEGNDGVIVSVKEIIMHPLYDPRTVEYDVAILVLASPLPLNNFTIRKIELIDGLPTDGTMTAITGWGAVKEGGGSPQQLQEVKVPIVSNEKCNEDYGGGITDSMLCAGLRGQGGKDACQGDSGGPLVVRNKLAGIVSWGAGCARPEYPGVYSNVWSMREWILEKVAPYQ